MNFTPDFKAMQDALTQRETKPDLRVGQMPERQERIEAYAEWAKAKHVADEPIRPAPAPSAVNEPLKLAVVGNAHFQFGIGVAKVIVDQPLNEATKQAILNGLTPMQQARIEFAHA